jgi:hypothetical protein
MPLEKRVHSKNRLELLSEMPAEPKFSTRLFDGGDFTGYTIQSKP